jgi:hypothetical protein
LVAVLPFRYFGRAAADKAEHEATCVSVLEGDCFATGASFPVGVGQSDRDGPITGEGADASASLIDGSPLERGRRFLGGVASGAWTSVRDLGRLGWDALPPVLGFDLVRGRPNIVVDAATGVTLFALSASLPGRLVAAMGGPDVMTAMLDGGVRQFSSAWSQDSWRTAGQVTGTIGAMVATAAIAGRLVQAGALARGALATETVSGAEGAAHLGSGVRIVERAAIGAVDVGRGGRVAGLVGSDDPLRTLLPRVEEVANRVGGFHFLVHGEVDWLSETGAPAFEVRQGSHITRLTSSELAQQIKMAGWKPGEIVYLWACNAGTCTKNFPALGQGVANALGNGETVIAPNGIIWAPIDDAGRVLRPRNILVPPPFQADRPGISTFIGRNNVLPFRPPPP